VGEDLEGDDLAPGVDEAQVAAVGAGVAGEGGADGGDVAGAGAAVNPDSEWPTFIPPLGGRVGAEAGGAQQGQGDDGELRPGQ
jgi:hypothetical protein